MRKFLVTAVVALVGLFSAPDARADVCSVIANNLVVNCGFESGNFSGWTQGGNTSGTGVGNFAPGPNSGSFDGFFGPVGSVGLLTQTIATTPGTTYTVSFFLRNQSSVATNSFLASFGGSNLLALNNAAAFGYTHYTFSVVATGSLTDLQFAYRHDQSEWFLDDISVTAAVPEPATMLLLGSGLLGVTAIVRNRRKSRL